jgi:hypothetical protein
VRTAAAFACSVTTLTHAILSQSVLWPGSRDDAGSAPAKRLAHGAWDRVALPTVPCDTALQKTADQQVSASCNAACVIVTHLHAENMLSCRIICDMSSQIKTRYAPHCRVTHTVATQPVLSSGRFWDMQICITAAPGKLLLDQHCIAQQRVLTCVRPHANTLLRPSACGITAWLCRCSICTPQLETPCRQRAIGGSYFVPEPAWPHSAFQRRPC